MYGFQYGVFEMGDRWMRRNVTRPEIGVCVCVYKMQNAIRRLAGVFSNLLVDILRGA